MFQVNNRFWSSVSRLTDIVGLSILWIFLCLPVITLAPATAALYFTIVKSFRQGEESTFRTMLRAFRDNLRRGIPVSITAAAALILLGAGYSVMAQNRSGVMGFVMYCIYCAALLLPAGMLCCAFPMLGRFSLDFRQLFQNAFLLTLGHAPVMVLLVLLNLAAVIWTAVCWYPVFFLPVLLTLLSTYLLEPVFAKHLSEDERARLLNLTDTEEDINE